MNAVKNLVLTEGWTRIAAWLAAAVVLAVFDCELFAMLACLVAGILTWTYRRPVRTVAHFEVGAVTSPCDGRVSRVRTEESGEIVIEIETGCLDASMLCSPFEAKLSDVKVIRGARLRRTSPLRPLLNEQGSVGFLHTEGHRVMVSHSLARESAPLTLERLAHVLRGAQYGVMTAGTTYVRLPAGVRIAVNPGERVRAVETLLGYLS